MPRPQLLQNAHGRSPHCFKMHDRNSRGDCSWPQHSGRPQLLLVHGVSGIDEDMMTISVSLSSTQQSISLDDCVQSVGHEQGGRKLAVSVINLSRDRAWPSHIVDTESSSPMAVAELAQRTLYQDHALQQTASVMAAATAPARMTMAPTLTRTAPSTMLPAIVNDRSHLSFQ